MSVTALLSQEQQQSLLAAIKQQAGSANSTGLTGEGNLLPGLKMPGSAKLEGISDIAQGVASVASGIIGGRARRR